MTDFSFGPNEKELLKLWEIESIPWSEARTQRFSDYEVVIVDLKIIPGHYDGIFVGLKNDVQTLLSAGGVLFVLLYATIQTGHAFKSGGFETNYDLLPSAIIGSTGIKSGESRAGKNFKCIAKEDGWINYFFLVSQYIKTIEGIKQNNSGFEIWYWDPHSSKRDSCPVKVLAKTQMTNDPVACLIQFNNGTLSLLPRPKELRPEHLLILQSIGRELCKNNKEELGRSLEVFPEWLDTYKTDEYKQLERHVDELHAKIKHAQEQITYHKALVSCLCSVGPQLERSVTAILKEFGWTLEDKTEKGEQVDYVITSGKRKLLVNLTGLEGYVSTNNKKFSQLLGALGDIKEGEHVVFLANTYASKDPKSREKNITQPALERLRKNDICFLTVYDLYRLWKDFHSKRKKPEEVFDSIFKAIGEYQYGLS